MKVLTKSIRARLSPAYRYLQALLLIYIPLFANWMVLRSIQTFPHNSRVKDNAAQDTIICIWEGDQRLEWLAPASIEEKIRLIWLPRQVAMLVFKHLLVGYKQDATLGEPDLDYYYQPKFVQKRTKFRLFCEGILGHIVKTYNAKALIVPKLNDDWIIDFNQAAMSVGIPVVANDRESIITPKRMEVYPPMLRAIINDLQVSAVALNNEIHYDFWRKSGYPTEKLYLTGKPDTDYWRHRSKWQQLSDVVGRDISGKKIILYFSFSARTYMNFYYGSEPRTFQSLADDVHNVLSKVLLEQKDALLIYKTGGKQARDYYSGYDTFIDRLRRHDLHKNVIPLNSAVRTWDIVRQSDVVVGFQTSGLIEAMFTDQPIVYCGWGELHDDLKLTLLPFIKTDALTHAESPDALRQYLMAVLSDGERTRVEPDVMKIRTEFREQYFSQPDGEASNRLLRLAMSAAFRQSHC